MILRQLVRKIKSLSKKMPALALTGPRQSGKTTLAKLAFPQHEYVNLENTSHRELALGNPQEFLSKFKKGVIFDEVQRAPELLSYLQLDIDEHDKPGKFILTGSHQFLLMEKVTQSLAGRIALFNLLPFSLQELQPSSKLKNANSYIFNGFYPRLHDKKIKPVDFYPSYIDTYVERDVRQIVNLQDLRQFRTFLKLCAGRIGQNINFSEMGSQAGVDFKTIQRWLSVLEAGFIIYMLPGYHKNFKKRITKAPRLYFYDSGVACSLLGITHENQLHSHWAKGALFENFVITELMKNRLNDGLKPSFYYWRNNSGKEVDLIIEEHGTIKAVEIKSNSAYSLNQTAGLTYFSGLAGIKSKQCYLVYGGDVSLQMKQAKVVSWKGLSEI